MPYHAPLDWDDLDEAFYGDSPSLHRLDDVHRKALLKMIYQNREVGSWSASGAVPDADDFDDIEAFLGELSVRLQTPAQGGEMTPILIVTLTGAQELGDTQGIDEQLEFDNIEYDPGDLYDDVNFEWTVEEDGIYRTGMVVGVANQGGSTGVVRLKCFVNGSVRLSSGNWQDNKNVSYKTGAFLPQLTYLEVDDVVDYYVAHWSTNSNVETSTAGDISRFWVEKF